MAQSRESQVSLSDTPYYHCISRCVRRAYLYQRFLGFYFNNRNRIIFNGLNRWMSALFSLFTFAMDVRIFAHTFAMLSKESSLFFIYPYIHKKIHNTLSLFFLSAFLLVRKILLKGKEDMPSLKESYEYIIIGGGSSGCVMVNRLAKAGKKVLLLEEGPVDNSKFVHIPATFIRVIGTERTFIYRSKASPEMNGRATTIP